MVLKNFNIILFFSYREVLAHPQILNATDRVEWRNIELSKEDETDSVERFRERFKEFDFTV